MFRSMRTPDEKYCQYLPSDTYSYISFFKNFTSCQLTNFTSSFLRHLELFDIFTRNIQQLIQLNFPLFPTNSRIFGILREKVEQGFHLAPVHVS